MLGGMTREAISEMSDIFLLFFSGANHSLPGRLELFGVIVDH